MTLVSKIIKPLSNEDSKVELAEQVFHILTAQALDK